MKPNQQWVDHGEAHLKKTERPHLRLIVSPPEAPPDSPTEKAIKSISGTTEIVLALFAQGLLIIGLFMASQYLS